MENLAERLGRVWHFRHLAKPDLVIIVRAGKLRHHRADTFIFHEGEPAAGMFVLFSGCVHLCKLSPGGQEQILATIKPVIMFNEVTAIDGGPNPFSALAAENCLTWGISHEAFEDLVRRFPDPEIGLGMLRVMASRSRLLIGRCEDLSFRPVLSRTAKLLFDLCADGEMVIDRSKHSIKELAAQVATVPEAISRSLGTLKERGLIDTTRQQITILNPEALAEVAQIEPVLPFE
jgi:CRP/FNR family transcriptional regulator